MPTYPTSLQTQPGDYPDATAEAGKAFDNTDGAGLTHRQWMARVGAALVALETKVGISGSADTNSHEYKIANLAAASSPLVAVAAFNSPHASSAQYQCDGVADEVQINQALTDLAATGGTVILLPGTYTFTANATVVMNPSSATATTTIFFLAGAIWKDNARTGTTPFLQVKGSKCDVWNPCIQGSGNKGNGTGILMVGDAVGVHDCTIYSPQILNLNVGVEFGIVGSNSTGDCKIDGGAIYQCQTAVKNTGFTNRCDEVRMYSSTLGFDHTADRSSQKGETVGCTFSQNSTDIWVRRGNGSTHHNVWIDTGAAASSERVKIGDGTNKPTSVRFTGTTKIGLVGSESSAVNVQGGDAWFEDVTLSTNANPPTNAVFVNSGTGIVTVNRLRLWPGTSSTNRFGVTQVPTALTSVQGTSQLAKYWVATATFAAAHNIPNGAYIIVAGVTPTAYNGTFRVRSVPSSTTLTFFIPATSAPAAVSVFGTVEGYCKPYSNTSTGRVTVREHFDIIGSTAGGTIGDGTPAASPTGTYAIHKATLNAVTTYYAKDRFGGIVAFCGDTTNESGLKFVLEALCGTADTGVVTPVNDLTFEFGPGRYHFKDAPLGTEAWAGVQDHFSYGTSFPPIHGLTFKGAGPRATIVSNYTNQTPVSNPLSNDDTEPFSSTNAQFITIRDLQVESCGVYKSTTDAIDFDQPAGNVIDNVRVIRSRSRAVVLDGGDAGRNARWNRVINCIMQGCPEMPGLAAVAGGTLAQNTAYRYVVSWVISDLGGVGVPGETQVSDEALITTDTTNLSVRVNLPIGPYDCTGRKVYRAPQGSNAWVLLTTQADNTTETFVDTGGAGSAVTMPVSLASAIPQAGIELLGNHGNLVQANVVDGCGDASAASQYGINLNAKSKTGQAVKNADRNRIIGNHIRGACKAAIHVNGGSDNIIAENIIRNPGSVATKAEGIRIENVVSGTTAKNNVHDNRVVEDRDANSTHAGKGLNNGVNVVGTNTVTGTKIHDNVLDTGTNANINDTGTGTAARNNDGFNPQGVAAITVGASPFVYTAGITPEVVHISGGTVSAVTKSAVTLYAQSNVAVPLEPHDSVTVTYSVAPTMNKDGK